MRWRCRSPTAEQVFPLSCLAWTLSAQRGSISLLWVSLVPPLQGGPLTFVLLQQSWSLPFLGGVEIAVLALMLALAVAEDPRL